MNRRTHERMEVWLPVRVDQVRRGLAVTHNVSKGGMLLATAGTLEVGAEQVLSARAS